MGFFQKIEEYSFDCFKDENPTLWTNIQKCFWTLVHGFVCDEYTSRAASLTYYTVTSIVPFMALMLSMISKESINKLKDILPDLVPVKEDVVKLVFNSFEKYGTIQNQDVNILFKIGTIILMVWATYNLFYNLIHTLNNTIWGVEDRSLGRRVIFYICTIAIVVFFKLDYFTLFAIKHLDILFSRFYRSISRI